MREHTAEFLDLAAVFGPEGIPVDPETGQPIINKMLPLEQGATWRTRVKPVDLTVPDVPTNWGLIREGQLVRIPLIPYRTSIDPAEVVLGAMDIIQRCVEAVPNAVRTHIIVGRPLQDLSSEGVEGLRLWIGFAAQMS